MDIENGDEYWISGLKKRESNRHGAGYGKILIDRRAVDEYLSIIGEKELPQNLFEAVEMEDKLRELKNYEMKKVTTSNQNICF